MGYYLGIDTSNYTTSVALYNSDTHEVRQRKQLLPVKNGTLGLKQSDAVFSHVRQLPQLMEELFSACPGVKIESIGVSTRPRNLEGSYMPCFLTGKAVAVSLASVLGVPLHEFSHQEGHVTAALYSTGRLDLLDKEFIAFHLSGGTTEGLHCDGRSGSLEIRLFSATSDLNAGQAVDRVGVAMGLPFPAGPHLEKLALASEKKFKARVPFRDGNPSISGLENQCLRRLADGESHEDVARYALAYIQSVVEGMTKVAKERFGELPLIYAGGVMSNSIIREAITKEFGGLFAEPIYSTDNAVGISLLNARAEGVRWQN